MNHLQDNLTTFLLDEYHVRGVVVQLNKSLQTIMHQHAYTPPVDEYLSHLLLSSCLLMGTMKTKGVLTIQLNSQGPIELLVAKVDHDLQLRGLAKCAKDAQAGALETDFSGGRLAVTLQQEQSQQPVQSIVPIKGRRIGQALQDYFSQSEQINTQIVMAVNRQCGTALLLQALPQQTVSEAAWQHVTVLVNTLKREELLNLPATELVYRLFHQDKVQCYPAREITFACPCSYEKMQHAVFLHGREQAQAILDEFAFIQVTCDYCNQSFQFKQDDVDKIFNIH